MLLPILAAACLFPTFADQPPMLPIGADAPGFRLPGVDGRTHSLNDFADSRVLVVAFTCNHCPTAQAYEARLAKFHQDYQGKGVALVAISPNDPQALRLDELGYTDLSDSFDEMKIRARDHKYAYPYLYDGDDQKVSRAYGVLATPHIFIFDANRKLRYNGRFDDSEVKEVKSHDAINAVEALLARKDVPTPSTRVVGCSTKWSDKREDARKSLAKWNAEPVSIEPIDAAGVARLVRNQDEKKLLVVNLWATWCGPCVQELPELVTINRMYRNRPFRMVTLSLDEPEKKDEALRLLTENKVAVKNYLVAEPDRDKLAEALDREWPGPVPHTLVIEPGGRVIYRKSGAFDPLELKRAIVAYLGRTY